MHSRLVVVSWWSNCLALTCLSHLLEHVTTRPIYVIQAGKSPEGCQRFRSLLPAGVTELVYPADAPAEHSRVIRHVALDHFAGEEGVWFFDHDVFVQTDCDAWLQTTDEWLAASEVCLCIRQAPSRVAITAPAFWISPSRLPASLANFDPIPFRIRDESRRPDLFRNSGELQMPIKDTLVDVWEHLLPAGRAAYYTMQNTNDDSCPPLPFPPHIHLGGLFLLAGPVMPPAFHDWMVATVDRFTAFYENSPWRDAEDPVLLDRLAEFRKVCYG